MSRLDDIAEVERLRAALTESQAQAVNSLSGTGRYEAEIEAEHLRADLAVIGAAYDQRDKAFLDLLEMNADKDNELARLQRECDARHAEQVHLASEVERLRAELAAAIEVLAAKDGENAMLRADLADYRGWNERVRVCPAHTQDVAAPVGDCLVCVIESLRAELAAARGDETQ